LGAANFGIAPALVSSRAPLLSVLPETEATRDDSVTAFRREMKFALRGIDLRTVLEVLSGSTASIAFGDGPVSYVNSIYFDDHGLTAARESLDGVDPRSKIRLRWYDSPFPKARVTFELKQRSDSYIRKHRVPLALASELGMQPYDRFVSELTDILPDSAAAWLAVRSEPTVLVTYARRHFRDRDSGMRLTVDYDIAGFDQTAQARPSRRFGVPLHDLVVIEAKASVVDELRVRHLLYPLKPQLTRSSKYLQCCRQMGWSTLVD
jgi:hypothetical protein